MALGTGTVVVVEGEASLGSTGREHDPGLLDWSVVRNLSLLHRLTASVVQGKAVTDPR